MWGRWCWKIVRNLSPYWLKKGIRKRILVIYFLRGFEEAGWTPTPMSKPRLAMNTNPLTLTHSSKLRLHSPLEGRGLNGLINLRSPEGLLAINRETQIRNTDGKIKPKSHVTLGQISLWFPFNVSVLLKWLKKNPKKARCTEIKVLAQIHYATGRIYSGAYDDSRDT